MAHRKFPVTRTGEEIAALVAEYRIKPSHSRGQHFLIEDDAYDDILEVANLSSRDHVLEVGPGLGTLTERLAEVAGKVTAVEVDQKLVKILQYRFRQTKKISICPGNILSSPVSAFGVQKPYHVVSNIPYYLTGNFFRKFLSDDVQPQTMTVLIQKEVAERMTATPGDMSLLALSVQLYSSPKIIRFVSAQSFFPPPEVESALVHCADIHTFLFTDIPEKFFWRVARVGFASPRKQLKNNLLAGFTECTSSKLMEIFSAAKISERARAEDVTIDQWHTLAVYLLPLTSKGVY